MQHLSAGSNLEKNFSLTLKQMKERKRLKKERLTHQFKNGAANINEEQQYFKSFDKI